MVNARKKKQKVQTLKTNSYSWTLPYWKRLPWASPTVPLCLRIRNKALNSSLPSPVSLGTRTLPTPWSPALLSDSCKKKSCLVKGYSTPGDTQQQLGQTNSEPLRNTQTSSLFKNLALSADRYNYYFIWKNIYHSNSANSKFQ